MPKYTALLSACLKNESLNSWLQTEKIVHLPAESVYGRMRSTIFYLFMLLTLTACRDGKQHDNHEPKMEIFPVRFLALGDSYTIGEGVAEAGRWPNQLADTLSSLGLSFEKPLIIARTGWTTADLKAGIEAADPKGPFDLVSLLIGVNNQYRGPSRGYTPENYRLAFAALLQQSIAFAGGEAARVFVVSIPDYSVTPFVPESNKARVAEEIDQYNHINRQETEKAGVTYVDITPISRLAANDKSLLASDNLHPSASMYRMWVELMAEKVIRKVKTR